MKKYNLIISLLLCLVMLSCVSKKKFLDLNSAFNNTTSRLQTNQEILEECNNEKAKLQSQLEKESIRFSSFKTAKEDIEKSLGDQIQDLKAQIQDLKTQREQQYTQVGDLTVLSKSANENMNQTIKQLESKDKYIRYLMDAKSKADSINLALAVNIKSVLKKGIEDQDIDVKVDKTVVFINLSDKMLYESGSYRLTSRAGEVLAKIAEIIKSKPELELMVEGYTDDVPIRNSCIEDNWDLSVRRAAQVVKTLQKQYGVDPNKLIAAGRGEYNKLTENETAEGKAMNRRTRIILLPKLAQFYDLLKPQNIK